MEYFIREFEISDCDGIRRLNSEELGYDSPFEDTAAKLTQLKGSSADKIFVAAANGKLVGYIHACDYDVIYMPHMKNIMGIAVSGKYRRCGIGSALLDRVEEWAKETGAAAVRLNSGAARADAHEFYRRRGYGGEKPQLRFTKKL